MMKKLFSMALFVLLLVQLPAYIFAKPATNNLDIRRLLRRLGPQRQPMAAGWES